MNKDEVLKLALEALRLYQRTVAPADTQCRGVAAVAAIEQALAAPVQPVKPSLWEQYHAAQPAVQEPIGYAVPTFDFDNSVIKKVHYAGTVPLYTTPPAAQRQWVGLTDAEVMQTMSGDWTSQFYFARAIEAKLKEKNAVAQPAVPDAMTSADIQEHIEYVAGWNDCRQAMLEMMK